MSEEEKKALKVINARTRRLLDELEIEKEDMSDELEIAYLMQEIRANKTVLNLLEKLQKENEKLKDKLLDTIEGQKVIKKETPQYIKENFISKQRIKNEIAKMQEEYNKVDKKIELYLKKKEKTMQELYENRDNVGELQMIAYFIQTLQEILEESEDSKNGEG